MGVDFTRQIAKDRENYRSAVKKNNDANEKRLEEAEARHKHIQEKQLDVFTNDKHKMEKSYETQLSNLQDKTRDSIEGNQDEYNKKLDDERTRFTQESGEKRREFDQRFNDIKNSYHRSFASEKDLNKSIQDTQKENYQRSITENKKDSHQKLSDYQERMLNQGGALKDQYNHERHQLVRAQEDYVKDIQKDHSKKNADLKNRIGEDIKKTREVSEADAAQTRKYASDTINGMREKFDSRSDAMTKDYSERNRQLTEDQQRDNLRTNREHQKKTMDLQRDYNRDLRSLELTNRKGDFGDGEFADVMEQQQGLNDKVHHENQLRSMRSKLTNAQQTYQDRASREQASFNETLKQENGEAAIRLKRNTNDLSLDKVKTIAHERDKNTRQLENLEHIGMMERQASQQNIITERNDATSRMKKLKENFNKSMVDLQDRNNKAVEEITTSSNLDKANFVKKLHEIRNQEVFHMKREYTRLVNSLVEDYEKRIGQYQRDNEHLKLVMDQKVTNITDQTEKQMAQQRKNYDDQKSSEHKSQALLNDQKEFLHKTEVTQLNTNFQKKLDKHQIASETKLKLLTNDYENKLKELRTSTSKTLAEKEQKQMIDQERMKQSYEAEKMRIVTGFENQISEMKKAHTNQVDQLKEYKRLS